MRNIDIKFGRERTHEMNKKKYCVPCRKKGNNLIYIYLYK